jgi:uncharacterized protein YvpB
MRHHLTRVVAVLVALTMLAPLLTPMGTSAASVTAWVQTSSKTPGVGCSLDVSVEVRSGGGAVSGADVSIALSEDGTSNVISSTGGTTNGSGIARVSLDTSAGWDGMKGWMEVAVNGSYLGGQTIWITDGSCSGNGTLVEMNGSATTVIDGGSAPDESSDSSEAAPTDNSGGKVIIPNVWTYHQQRGLSCEYASLSIATGALGNWIDEYDFDDVVPLNANPHWGYRGDITGSWGNTDNYGVYAEPLVPALQHFGFNGNVFYGGTDNLTAAIDRGEPTLVWIGVKGDISHDEYTSDGTRYQLTRYMHVVVVYGYDDGGVYISDPGPGEYSYLSWNTFNSMWNVMDGMSLSVSK